MRKGLSEVAGTTGDVAGESRTLGELVAERMPALRQAAGVTQDDVARAADRRGFRWSRLTVRDVERGARRLTVEEFAALPVILDDAGCRTLRRGGPRLLLDDDRVQLAPGLVVDGRDLRMPLHRTSAVLPERASVPADEDEPTEQDLADVDAALGPAPDDAEAKATVRLRELLGLPALSVVDVQLAAGRLWGRRLAEERDARLAQQDLPPRRRQAARGFTTRALLDELAPTITTER